MGDLTDSHFIATGWPLPLARAQCESMMRAPARFHGAWWDDPACCVDLASDDLAYAMAMLWYPDRRRRL